ncbi:MAG: DUF3352 domain-containing protein [Armatimonadetes bacterium]|nr:DUF3352 domain-containing protein [Armatimonadota bacterium]
MLTRRKYFFVICIMAAFMGGTSIAQQPTPANIWQLAPSDSVMIAGFDGREDNSSFQAILKAETPEARDLRLKQKMAMRKAVENFYTLFGISLDFAKDIDSWESQQWAFVVLPDGKDYTPVLLMASHDAAAANAALQKMLEPWQRIGEISPQDDSDFSITAFKTSDKSVEIYASVTGSVMAFSPSKAALKQALQGGGFAADSAGDKALKALSGSMFYAYADAKLLKLMGVKESDVPVSGVGIGVSVIDTGAKLRMLGYLTDEGAAMAKQMLPPKSSALVVNPGIPDPSLIAVSLPDLSGLGAMFNMPGVEANPITDVLTAIGGTQLSASITAALPMPAGVITAMAASEQEATAKLEKISAGLKTSQFNMKPNVMLAGIQTTSVVIPDGPTMYLTQIGQYVVLASDAQSLSSAAKAIKGEKMGMAQSDTYKETMAALGDSNLMTMYVNFAPIQGLGYLIDGLGFGQVVPLYGSLAKSIQEMKAMGIGIGFDGEAINATMFLRAKPGIGAGMAAAVSGIAIGSAVMFPVYARARGAARQSTCQNYLRELAIAAMIYAQDWDGKLPSSANWKTQLNNYLKWPKAEYKCTNDAIYAFNKNLGGLNIKKIQNPSDIVLFFEANPGLPNATGSRANAILPHDGRGCFVYLDGHVISLSEVPSQSHWVPKYTAPKPVKKVPVPRKHR